MVFIAMIFLIGKSNFSYKSFFLGQYDVYKNGFAEFIQSIFLLADQTFICNSFMFAKRQISGFGFHNVNFIHTLADGQTYYTGILGQYQSCI